ncbi:MAG: hypothetical protein L0Y71_13150, partial [Gemmataceae bacterium]|nr:hypothetical protein [Gemmataceae bacterium]
PFLTSPASVPGFLLAPTRPARRRTPPPLFAGRTPLIAVLGVAGEQKLLLLGLRKLDPNWAGVVDTNEERG